MPETEKGGVRMWISMIVRRYPNLQLPGGFSFQDRADDGSIGFCQVYETREDAESANPGIPAVAVQETKEER